LTGLQEKHPQVVPGFGPTRGPLDELLGQPEGARGVSPAVAQGDFEVEVQGVVGGFLVRPVESLLRQLRTLKEILRQREFLERGQIMRVGAQGSASLLGAFLGGDRAAQPSQALCA
jgi:hypothetical protein